MPPINRRQFIAASVSPLVLPGLAGAQSDRPEGRIAFVMDGDIHQWSNDGVERIKVDGAASSPTWRPGTNEMMYVRDGGSYSNLIVLDTVSGRTRRITDSESDLQRGSAAWVWNSWWITDPFWSESGIVSFSSTADSPDGVLQLWLLRYHENTVFLAPYDEKEQGRVEGSSVDAAGKYAVYTITGLDGMSSSIGMRDLDTGETSTVLQGVRGAFDAAIAPQGDWVVGTIRDGDGLNDLWIVDPHSGGKATRLTYGEQASRAVWDPTGSWVAYLSFTGKGFSLRAFALDFEDDEPSINGDIQLLVGQDGIRDSTRLSWSR